MAANGKYDLPLPRGIGVRTRRMYSTFVWSDLAWLVSVSDDQHTGLVVTQDAYCLTYLDGRSFLAATTEDRVVFPELPGCQFQAHLIRRGCYRCQRDSGCGCPWRDTLLLRIAGGGRLPPPVRLQIHSPVTCYIYLDRGDATIRCVGTEGARGAMTKDGDLDQHAWRGRIGCCPGPDGVISVVEVEGKGDRVRDTELVAYHNTIGS